MDKVLNIQEAINKSLQLKKRGERIVLAGGCFDILHQGHIEFLKRAKKQGDILFVFLESDEKVKSLKGITRPINSQKDRAKILKSIPYVDYLILLPFLDNTGYDNLVNSLKPDIIATTKGDKYRSYKERQAKKINAAVVDVIKKLPNKSTTALIRSMCKL